MNKLPLLITCSSCMHWGGVSGNTYKHCIWETLLTDIKYLYVNCNRGSHICVVEWTGVNMWCVNQLLINKILLRVNSKLGHFSDQILFPKESLKPIICMDIWDIWIKFLRLMIIIVANLNIVVLLDYSNPIFR
jgi:type IV secretory pathway VirB3-like protein